MNISIRKMRAFLAIVEEQHFTKAAHKQNISQPAITIIVNQLEEELEKELFVRQGKARTPKLTKAGRSAAETFARVLANFDTEIDKLAVSTGDQREQRIFLIQSSLAGQINPDWFDAILSMLKAERLVIEEAPREDIINRIYERKASLALLDGRVDQERADYVSIADYRLILAVPNGVEVPTKTNGAVAVNDLPDGSYLTGGWAREVNRGIASLFRSTGSDHERLEFLNGHSVIHSAVKRAPRPIIAPSFLAPCLAHDHGCTVHEIGPNNVQSLVGLVAPWGYMSQYRLELIRRFDCFNPGSAQEPE